MSRRANYNEDALVPADTRYYDEQKLFSPPAEVASASVQVHFSGIAERIEAEIHRSSAVFGAVAWLTNERLLRALAGIQTARFVVQKEDFLRQESGKARKKSDQIRSLYAQIRGGDRHDLPNLFHELSQCGAMEHDAIRCVGISGDRNGFARMHHKFAVFCDRLKGPSVFPGFAAVNHYEPVTAYPGGPYLPHTVVTGSFNWTENATASRENVVIIRDCHIATAYLQEWAQVFSISEPLDWTSEYFDPEWRVGS